MKRDLRQTFVNESIIRIVLTGREDQLTTNGFRVYVEVTLKQMRNALAQKLISVVDDDESVRRTTKLLIESFGYRAATFGSAETFLRSEQLDDTSCLITDLHMPRMNGFQLQSYLADAGSWIPVIFITAFDDRESRRRATEAGAVALLEKPFTDEWLFQMIRRALRKRTDGTAA